MDIAQETITSQPSPAELAHASNPSNNPVNEVVVTQPLFVPELNDELPDVSDTEEEMRKKRRKEDCCFYIEPNDEPYDWFILCRCVFWICRSIGDCTDRCCDCCAENTNECCNGECGCCDIEGCCCVDTCCDGIVECLGDICNCCSCICDN